MANDNARKFLEAAGWGDAAREPLTGDASARKYVRLRKSDRTAILMDASRLPEIVAPFVRIDAHLRQLGFSAPEILARDEARQPAAAGRFRRHDLRAIAGSTS